MRSFRSSRRILTSCTYFVDELGKKREPDLPALPLSTRYFLVLSLWQSVLRLI